MPDGVYKALKHDLSVSMQRDLMVHDRLRLVRDVLALPLDELRNVIIDVVDWQDRLLLEDSRVLLGHHLGGLDIADGILVVMLQGVNMADVRPRQRLQKCVCLGLALFQMLGDYGDQLLAQNHVNHAKYLVVLTGHLVHLLRTRGFDY